jgi:hypothetical protein
MNKKIEQTFAEFTDPIIGVVSDTCAKRPRARCRCLTGRSKYTRYIELIEAPLRVYDSISADSNFNEAITS